MSTHSNHGSSQNGRPDRPSVAEIAELLTRLRHLRGPDADPAERASFLADKAALLARIDQTAAPAGQKGGQR